MKSYLKLMRVHHYVKNGLVFAALACSGQLFHLQKLLCGAAGFLAFCMISSVVYILNDVRDAEKDRLHPAKRSRPIASGAVSVQRAYALACVLLLAAALCVAMTGRFAAALLLVLYLLLNIAYSVRLKHIPIVDVAILVSGFLIRIFYGALITDIVISNWLYLTVIVAAFYFALGKRRNELRLSQGNQTRAVLSAYPPSFLEQSMNMCLTLATAFYALWTMDEKTSALYHSDRLVFTVPLVLLILLKYSLNIENESDGDPVEVLLRDRLLLALCFIYLSIMFFILYF